MTVTGIIAICAITLTWVLWPVFRPAAAARRARGLPLDQLEPPPREGERHEGRREAE